MRGKFLFLICLFFLEACSGGGGSSSHAISGVTISPRPLAVQKGNTLQLAAKDLSGQSIPQSDLTWSVDGTSINGTVNSNGFYSAPPNIPPQNLVTLRATLATDSTKNDAISFYILTAPVLNFGTSSEESTTLPSQGGSSKFQMAVFGTNLYVTWMTTDSMNTTHLWYSKGDKNGLFSTPPHDVLLDIMSYPNYNSITGVVFKNPIIAIDNKVDSNGDPGLYIAWDDNSSGRYQVNMVKGPNSSGCGTSYPNPCFTPFIALTGPGGFSLQVEPTGFDQSYPALALGMLGKIEITWSQVSSGVGNLIYFKELNPDGSVFKPASLVSPLTIQTTQSISQIGTDSQGNISVAWLQYTATTLPSIFYSRWQTGALNFQLAVPVESDPLSGQDTFSMTLDYYGQPHLAWSKSSSGTPTGIYYSTTADFSQFTTPVQLTSGGVNPTVKVDLLNNLYFSWDNGVSTYFQKLGASPGPLSLAAPQLVKSGVNPVMNIDDGGRVYLLYSTTGSTTLSTYFIRGE